MVCAICASGNQAEFAAEIHVHFSELKNLGKPGAFVFPKLLVCMDCGFSRFTTPRTELALLAGSTPPRETSIRHESVDRLGHRCRIAL
jgi:hypothetical protein